MQQRWFSARLISLMVLLLMVIPAKFSFAIPIADYKEKMSRDERAGYLTGGISALTFQYADDGNMAKSKCVYDWFYKSDKGGDEMAIELMKARMADPSLHVEAVILAVIKKKCGHLDKVSQ